MNKQITYTIPYVFITKSYSTCSGKIHNYDAFITVNMQLSLLLNL